MKIAFFSDCCLDLTGGISISNNSEKKELEKRGHTVYLFSSAFPRSKKERQKLMKSNIFPVPSCKFFGRGLTPIARRPKIIEKWLEKNFPELKEFDVFYAHYEAGCSIAGLRFAKKFHIPVVQFMHGREDVGETNIIPFGFRTIVAYALNIFHSWYLPHKTKVSRDDYLADSFAKAKMWTLMVNHANFADLVITPSKHFADKLKHYGVKQKIIALPNGVSDEKFIQKLEPRQLEEGKTLKIVWHSRVSAEKRMMPFLEALTKVNGKYQIKVFGGGGDYFRAKRFAKKHHLNAIFYNNTKFDQIYKEVLNSHLDVLVSYNFDTFGMTLIEAESAGVPAFIVDPDLKEVLPKNSFLFSPSPSPEMMAKTLNSLFEQPEKIETMSKILLKNRDNVRISKRIAKLEKIFEETITSFL